MELSVPKEIVLPDNILVFFGDRVRRC